MITIAMALVNKLFLDSDDEIYGICLYTAMIDGLILWGLFFEILT